MNWSSAPLRFINPVALLLAAAIALCYAYTLDFPFQFDDYAVIVNNAKVHSLQGFWADFPGIRPLLKLSYTLNGVLDPKALGFRLVNIFLHLLCSLLVWKISGVALDRFRPNADNNPRIALLTALLFACHPAQTEVVTYISARSTGMMSMWYLLAFYLLITLDKFTAQSRRVAQIALAALCFAAALAVKETAWTLPLAFMLWSMLSGDSINRKTMLSLLLVSIAALVALLALAKYRELLFFSSTIRTPGAQLLGQIEAHFHLLTQTLFGINLNIDPALVIPPAFTVSIALKAALPLALLGIAWMQRQQRAWLTFGVMWYFLQLTITNGIIPRLDLVNDRQFYLPSVGLLLVISVLLENAFQRLGACKNIGAALVVVATLFLTCTRNQDYRDEISLWNASLSVNPNNARAWNNLGVALMNKGEIENARAAYQHALQLDANHVRAYFNLRELQYAH